MVKYKNNYINLVVLGSFNPGILTHEFLTKECHLVLGEQTHSQPVPVPVVASLEYGKVTFFADLGRLQITENSCENPEKSLIPQYAQTYLEKLEYTPLNKCGANFSYELSVDESMLNTVHSWLKDNRNKVLNVLGLGQVGLEVSFDITAGKEEIKTWIVRTKVEKNNATTMAKFHYGGGGRPLYVDFNFELPGLDKDKTLLKTVTAGYSDIFKMFKNQIESIFAG